MIKSLELETKWTFKHVWSQIKQISNFLPLEVVGRGSGRNFKG